MPVGDGARPGPSGGFGAGEGDPPQASNKYVFVANPQGRSVVIIDSEALTIRSIETGSLPSFLRTIPGSDAALVLNVGTGDASVVRVVDDNEPTARRLPIVKGANAIEVAPDGAHAVVFFDADASIAGDDFGDFQSVSVVDLTSGAETSVNMSVGFKPERVVFQADGKRAFVLTERAISVLDFGDIAASGAGIAPELTFGSQQIVRDEVIITADGRYAIAPMPGSVELRMLDLATGVEVVRQLWSLFPFPSDPDGWQDYLRNHPPDQPLPSNAPDGYDRYFVSLRYDAEGGQLLAVEPNFRTVVRVAIPGGMTGTEPILAQSVPHDVTAARSMPGTNFVLAYRPNVGVSKLSVIDFGAVPPRTELGGGGAGAGGDSAGGSSGEPGAATPAVATYDLRKGVEDVYVAPDGQTAIVRHDREDGDPNEPNIPLELRILRAAGHTLLHPLTGDIKLDRTAADIDGVVFSRDGQYAFLLFDDPSPPFPIGDQTSVREVHRVDLRRFVTGPTILLDSAPVAGAALPGAKQHRVFISQNHPDGRLTFVDWQTGDAQTVTGFELNSRVQN